MSDALNVGDIVHWEDKGTDYYGEIICLRQPGEHYFDSGYTLELRCYHDDCLYLIDPQ